MGVYGPFNATLNTVVKVTGIDVNADRVFIDNQSKYTLAVGFTPTQPTAVLTLLGQPWYAGVPPGGKTVHIPPAAYNEPFPGYFWVLALDPLTATRAYSGTLSLNTAFFVQSLVRGEPSPPDYAIPQAVDASSEARVINVPLIGPMSSGITTALATGTIITPVYYNLSAANKANSLINFYLYGLVLSLVPNTSAWTSLDVQIELITATAGLAVVDGPQTVFRGGLSVGATTDKPPTSVISYAPSMPGWVTLPVTAGLGATFYAVRFNAILVQGSNAFLDYHLHFDVDTANADAPGGIGQQPFYPVGPNNPRIF